MTEDELEQSRKVLLKSRIAVSKAMIDDMQDETKVERDWYRGAPRFLKDDDIVKAVVSGALVKIEQSDNILPTMRYRNPELHTIYPPYLTPKSAELLRDIGTMWRARCDELGIDKNIRLALTSMSRTVEYQEKIIASGKLAQPDSPHTNGEAFDIDGSGYYVGDVAVNNRAHEKSSFRNAFADIANPGQDSPEFRPDLYDPMVISVLIEVLNELKKEGRIHYLEEFPGTNNECYHVCRNPNWKTT